MIKDLEITWSRSIQECLHFCASFFFSFHPWHTPLTFLVLRSYCTSDHHVHILKRSKEKGKVIWKVFFKKRFWLFTKDVKPEMSFHILLTRTLHPDQLCKETGVMSIFLFYFPVSRVEKGRAYFNEFWVSHLPPWHAAVFWHKFKLKGTLKIPLPIYIQNYKK